MAWRSSGTNNNEMVDNLKRFHVITSPAVERGFRNVDRRFFVPQERENIAHADQPLKEGNVHISAPHIYGSALEALELTENASLSFLNVGSGTGYLSCIVASILGPYSVNYGVEIHQDVVDHSEASVTRWKASYGGKLPHMMTIQGNALNISMNEGEALIGFDRIYIGASVEQRDLSKVTALLKPGGVLVGPVGDELVKIVRIKRSSGNVYNSGDFSPQVLSGVRFSSLLSYPNASTVLPSRVWSPSVHHSYPDSFRTASKELLLCSHAPYVQPIPPEQRPEFRVNLAAALPRVIWMEILSYTHHNWFEPVQSEEALLRQRLLEEQENTRKAHQARLEAEARCEMLEHERDVHRLLARRWQSRVQALMAEQPQRTGNISIDDDDGGDVFALTSRERSAAMFGLGTMFRWYQSDDSDDDDSSDDDDDANDMDAEAAEEQNDEDLIEEDSDDDPDDVDEQAPDLEESEASMSLSSLSSSPRKALALRSSQVRTVSFSRGDF